MLKFIPFILFYCNVAVCSPACMPASEPSCKHILPAPQLSKYQLIATSHLLDASINSINALNSLIKKENYRNKITAFNNPTSSEMGFNLETEIQLSLKPLLDKAKNTNSSKFNSVVSSLIGNPGKGQMQPGVFTVTGIFSSLLSLASTLVINEKKVTRQDLDSFMLNVSKYFVQYEKLNRANRSFDAEIDRISFKLQELQFDIKEYLYDMICILNKDLTRQQLKTKSMEELMLKYLDKELLENLPPIYTASIKYPGDGIKTAKEIVYGIQKLFNEYQKIVTDNYQEIRSILLQSKELGKNINIKQVDQSLQELQKLYLESKDADVLNLRLNTLFERLKILVLTEQQY